MFHFLTAQVKAIVKSAVTAVVFVVVVNVTVVVVVVCVLLFHCLPQSLSFLSSYTLSSLVLSGGLPNKFQQRLQQE